MALFQAFESSGAKGFLHEPDQANGLGLVLTHGAGADCRSALLLQIAQAFTSEGWHVLRCDLAFRQSRPSGPPHPSFAAKDRESLRSAVSALGQIVGGSVALGGHSYGGRQASMLLADDPTVAAALLLFSYPLHPPKHPEKPRTEHWPRLHTPSIFVHGTVDPFASVAEMEQAMKLLPGHTELSIVEGAGHDLKRGKFDISKQSVVPLHGILGR